MRRASEESSTHKKRIRTYHEKCYSPRIEQSRLHWKEDLQNYHSTSSRSRHRRYVRETSMETSGDRRGPAATTRQNDTNPRLLPCAPGIYRAPASDDSPSASTPRSTPATVVSKNAHRKVQTTTYPSRRASTRYDPWALQTNLWPNLHAISRYRRGH